jgi:hypothetical protein
MSYDSIMEILREDQRQRLAVEEKAKKIRAAEDSGDFEALNRLAESEITRGARPKTVFEDATDVLKNEFPVFENPPSYKDRVELFFCLKLLTREYQLTESGNDQLRSQRLDEIKLKQQSIQRLLRPNPSINLSASNKNSKRAGNRKDNLRRAMDAAIHLMGKKPTLDELWNFFEKDRDTTGCVVDCTYDKITWTDTRGNLHDIQRESLANRLAKIKA